MCTTLECLTPLPYSMMVDMTEIEAEPELTE